MGTWMLALVGIIAWLSIVLVGIPVLVIWAIYNAMRKNRHGS